MFKGVYEAYLASLDVGSEIFFYQCTNMGQLGVFERRSLAAGMPEVKYNTIHFEIGPNTLYIRSGSPVGSWVFEIWRLENAVLSHSITEQNF